jgi:hypothetical protein
VEDLIAESKTLERDLSTLPAERLEADIVELTTRLADGTRRLLVLVGELDARGTWATWGALSCAAWLADACEIELATARTHVRVARAMRTHPELMAAVLTGRVSYAKARVLVPQLTDGNVQALVALAERTPAGRLGAAIAAWSRRHEDPEEIDRRHHAERRTSWRTDPDGMITITHRLPPERAAPVVAAIDRSVMSDRAPAGATLAQQRADALVALVTDGGARVRAEVVVHVDETGNHLPDGTPLSDHAVAGLLGGSFISLLLHDSERWPIDASPRRRWPTRRQRRVVDARQGACAKDGCSAQTLLQYDHIHPYGAGGPTTIDNLQRLCGPHNREKGG